MNLGQGVKELRKAKGIRQNAFAKAIGVSQTYLSQIEHCKKTPSTAVLNKIAKYLDIPLPVLFLSSLEESDISDNKKEAFRILKNPIDELIKSII